MTSFLSSSIARFGVRLLGLLLIVAVPAIAAPASRPAADLDAARLAGSASEPANWFTGGRDGNGTYHSPLARINDKNVGSLGFAWEHDLGAPRRGQEATPVVIDGVMYTSGTWGYVYALEAATGKLLWKYDPEANAQSARNPCCDLVNRGVAVWKGKVYVASVDGRLHAVEAATGKRVWVADTVVDHEMPYTSTGAPLIAGKVVVIGNGGSDMGKTGVRGYISAWDLETGQFAWRFYAVPAPSGPQEHPDLEAAAKTWDPRKPEHHGGGSPWDGLAYDADLDLVYFGTGNAAPYDLTDIGPTQFDALYTASIVAVKGGTGEYAWHYQAVPHDEWDFDTVQKFVLADLPFAGATRQVIMQASKNGFFYVLDRRTGELLAAKNYTYVNWTSGIDMKTGRPILTETANWHVAPKNVYPSWAGGHTWMPMSWNPSTRLMYIPVIDASNVWVDIARNGGQIKYIRGFFTVGGIMPDTAYDEAAYERLYGPLPPLDDLSRERDGHLVRELIRAWDPVAQKVVWEHETSGGARGYDGGTMSTAGNLVFQGRGNGELWVYAADSGKVLKVIPTGSHMMAAPSTFEVGGEQYVAVQAGYGGAGITVGPIPASSAASRHQNTNRIIAFKLGGGAVPLPPPLVIPPFTQAPAQTVSAEQITRGETLFVQECTRCHQFGPSVAPDLRKLSPGSHAGFKDIVLRGALAANGMGRFDDLLSEQEVEAIHVYLIDEARKGWEAQQQAAR